MPLLFPNFRVHQVFGGEPICYWYSFKLTFESANTEVGKTLLTTALLRASASRYVSKSEEPRKRVFYLKPVSTGPDSESDTGWEWIYGSIVDDADCANIYSYVQRNTKPYSSYISTHNLYQYREPMSPHLAAQLAPDLVSFIYNLSAMFNICSPFQKPTKSLSEVLRLMPISVFNNLMVRMVASS